MKNENLLLKKLKCSQYYCRGGSNEYPQSMFWSKNKKKYAYPCIPQFCYIKVGFKGVFIARTCFPDVTWTLPGASNIYMGSV